MLRVDKDRKTIHRLSFSLWPSLQTDVVTYRAAYGLSPLSIISLWLEFETASFDCQSTALTNWTNFQLCSDSYITGISERQWQTTADMSNHNFCRRNAVLYLSTKFKVKTMENRHKETNPLGMNFTKVEHVFAGASFLGKFPYSINALLTKRCSFSVTLVWSTYVCSPWSKLCGNLQWEPYRRLYCIAIWAQIIYYICSFSCVSS